MKQELFSRTRSGAVYLLHTKDQSHWFESTGEYKTTTQTQDKRAQHVKETKKTQNKDRHINQKKISTSEEKTQHRRKEKESLVREK